MRRRQLHKGWGMHTHLLRTLLGVLLWHIAVAVAPAKPGETTLIHVVILQDVRYCAGRACVCLLGEEQEQPIWCASVLVLLH